MTHSIRKKNVSLEFVLFRSRSNAVVSMLLLITMPSRKPIQSENGKPRLDKENNKHDKHINN